MQSHAYSVTLPQGFSDPYANLIRTLIYTEFPTRGHRDNAVLVDILTDELIATGRVRNGPRPSPESQVVIRQIIRACVDTGRPIPFVLPWGSEKPNGSGIDLAELFSLKTLSCLNNRIQRHYEPGALFNIRLEDVSAPHLFFERMDTARAQAALYCYGLTKLIDVLGFGHFIFPVRESDQVSEATFNAEADAILPVMESYLADSSEANSAKLARLGWSNGIPIAMREHYLGCYEKLYPDASPAEKLRRLARYFAGTLARRNLGLTGRSIEWGDHYLELAFTQPVPGDFQRPRRLHYRTIPSHITSSQVAPWRGRGYLRIHEHCARVGLASWQDSLAVEPLLLRLERDGERVAVQSDYMVVD